MKNITIVAIDTYQHLATDWAIRQTKRIFPDSPVMLVSDKPFYKDTDIFIETPPINRHIHSVICLQGIGEHLETDYALFVQWDGMPTNYTLWTDEFLEYDYVGAPWPWQPEGLNIGNGGFSLRSKRLCLATRELEPFYDREHDSYWLEDGMIGIHYRSHLADQGIRFAPTELAQQFSHEHPIGKFPSFGFHDQRNAQFYLTPNQLQQWRKLIK